MLRQARVLFLLVSMVIAGIEGHGYMMEPPQRSSAWRYRNDPDGILQKNYNDMGLNCYARCQATVKGNSHGYQENFWNCADIRIIGGESNPATTKPTTQAPPPTTAAPTTNPAAPVDTTLCRAIGIFAGVDEMDEFCRKQCSIPESCHTNLCDCSPPTTMPYCVPISEMLNVTVCEVLCLEDMAFCDNEFCYCIFGQETKTTKPATTTTTTTTTTPTTTTTTTTPAPNAVGDRTCKSVRPNDPGMDRWISPIVNQATSSNK
ncbi:hypothetical protein MAR_036260 [Mya arenaria]|uniref:Uncharacterized protein n=1 Tax=Mya arenaria TaxID=6604 RepID=A0ABY7EQF8_MYAAR|nr:hypothetical protein MAR_036260 [Mya arenaria]